MPIKIYKESEENKLLGLCLKKARVKSKLTQKELAKKIGVSQQTLASYEAGTRRCPAVVLIGISKALNMSIDSILAPRTFNNPNLSYKDIQEILQYIRPEDLLMYTDALEIEATNENTPAVEWAGLGLEIAQNIDENGQYIIKQFIDSVLDNPNYKKNATV